MSVPSSSRFASAQVDDEPRGDLQIAGKCVLRNCSHQQRQLLLGALTEDKDEDLDIEAYKAKAETGAEAMVAQDMVVAITPMLHHQTDVCEGGVITSAASHQQLMTCIQFSKWFICEFPTSTSRT